MWGVSITDYIVAQTPEAPSLSSGKNIGNFLIKYKVFSNAKGWSGNQKKDEVHLYVDDSLRGAIRQTAAEALTWAELKTECTEALFPKKKESPREDQKKNESPREGQKKDSAREGQTHLDAIRARGLNLAEPLVDIQSIKNALRIMVINRAETPSPHGP